MDDRPTFDDWSQPGVLNSCNAIAGRWYESSKHGRVLCCGTTGGDWIMAFAVRDEDGRTQMKYLHQMPVVESKTQGW